MSTSAIPGLAGSNTISTPTSTSASASSSAGGLSSLQPSDFIQMMITQLQNQDPTDPTSNEEILSQISQIGQLQSSDTLETDLSSMVLQDGISNAGSMIGKSIKGLDDSGNAANGIVNSVSVQNNKIYLQLDSGSSVQLSNVSAVAAGTSVSGTTSGTAAGSATPPTPTTPAI